MTKLIKTKQKTYPDGSITYTVYDELLISRSGDLLENTGSFFGDGKEYLTIEQLAEKREYERQKKIYQVKTKIKDYCLSNDFDYFWTLTFKENRHDDEAAFDKMQKWLKKMRAKYGTFRYLFIPERHEDGAIHFHGVTGGFKGVIEYSGKKHQGKDKKWHRVYNCLDYDLGFSTLSVIRNKKSCASYVTKYVTKDMINTPVRKGKKKYWSSRGLREPVITYSENNLCLGQKPDWVSNDGRVSIFNKQIVT